MQAVGSAATVAGLSIERTSAYIATVSSVTRQSASVIGRSLNSMLARYQNIRAKGFNDEDETKLNDVTKALESVGITAVDTAGQLRPFGEVMDELGKKFNTLETNERNYVATAMFGTFQMNRGIALLDNYDSALGSMEDAYESAGDAQKKFNIYQESTQAHIDRLTSSGEKLWIKLFNSNFIKGIIDLGTALLELVDKLDAVGVVMSTIALITIPLLIKGFYSLTTTGIIGTLGAMTAGTMSLAGGFKFLSAATMGASGSMKALVGFLNPVALLISSFALIVIGAIRTLKKEKEILDKLNDTKSDLKETQEELNKAQLEYNKSINEDTIKNYIASLEQQNALLEERLSLLKESAADALHDVDIERGKALASELRATEDMIVANAKNTYWLNYKRHLLKVLNAEQEAANEAAVAAALTLEEAEKKYESLDDAVSDYQSKLSSLADQYDSINDGEELSKENLLDLINTYPEHTDQILKNIGTKEGELKLTELLFEATKQKYIAEQQGAIEAAKAVAALNNINIDSLMINREFIENTLLDPSLPSTVADNLRSSLQSIDRIGGAQLAEIKARNAAILAMKGITVGNFNYSGPDKTKDKTKEEKKALKDYHYELEKIKRTKEELAVLESKQEIDGKDRTDQIVENLNDQQEQLHNINNLRRKDLGILKEKLKTDQGNVELIEKISSLEDDIANTSQEWFDIEKKKKDIFEQQNDALEEQKKLQQEAKEAQEDAQEDILNLLIDALKDRHEKKIDALDNEIDLLDKAIEAVEDAEKEKLKIVKEYIKESYDAQKELLQKELDEAERVEDRKTKVAEIEALQKKLSFASTEKEKYDLQEEIAEKQKALAREDTRFAVEQKIQQLEDAKTIEEIKIDAELDAIERKNNALVESTRIQIELNGLVSTYTVAEARRRSEILTTEMEQMKNSTQDWATQAQNIFNQGGNAVYNFLKNNLDDFSSYTTKMINDLLAKIATAKSAMSSLSSNSSVDVSKFAISDYTSSISSSSQLSAHQSAQKSRENILATDPDWAYSVGEISTKGAEEAEQWYRDNIYGKSYVPTEIQQEFSNIVEAKKQWDAGLPKYHDGGVVGGAYTNRKGERITKLLDGETVLTRSMTTNLFDKLSTLRPTSIAGATNYSSPMEVNITFRDTTIASDMDLNRVGDSLASRIKVLTETGGIGTSIVRNSRK